MARTPPSTQTMRLMELAAQYIRQPTGCYDEDGVGFVEFDPPLTSEEQAEFDLLRSVVRSGLDVDPAVYATIRANLQTRRDLRQLGRNGFMSLSSDAERFRRLYDSDVAGTIILLAILREP